MNLTIRQHDISFSGAYDFTEVRLLSDLDPMQLTGILRSRGIGYLDDPGVYVNTLWLRNQQEGPQWQAGIDSLITAAETLGQFDGVFIRTTIESLPRVASAS